MALITRRKANKLFCALILGVLIYFCIHMFVSGSLPDVGLQEERPGAKQHEYIDSNGMRVIVGRYIGNDVPGPHNGELTEEEINTNYYAPQKGQGDMGEPVQIFPHELARSQLLYKINSFNLLASDKIPLDRKLPDVRKSGCRDLHYDVSKLPTTSVVIVFHNEAWSTLMRTIHSVINRSPRRLLKEFILVDDASTRKFLKEPLEEDVAKLSVPVIILRSTQRMGLIKARLMGAERASGDVLTFLDAHCEATEGWLEPLLYRISQDRSVVVCPIIDIISDDTFALLRTFELHTGGFNWNLHFRWFGAGETLLNERKHNMTQPFRTPAMAGGLFAIQRQYFFDVGSYDEAMDIWGGENLEMSLRIWQCGGRVEIAPCSHVGHVFRKSSPYTFPKGVGNTLSANLARVALVWMDDWKNLFFKLNYEAESVKDMQQIRSRLALRERLQCKSFQWYLENVWPEHFWPTLDGFFGKIVDRISGECIERPSGGGGSQPNGKALLRTCRREEPLQYWTWQTAKPSAPIMTNEAVCLDPGNGEVRAMACSGQARQLWRWENGKIRHVESGKCLSQSNPPEPEGLTLRICETAHIWTLESVPWR